MADEETELPPAGTAEKKKNKKKKKKKKTSSENGVAPGGEDGGEVEDLTSKMSTVSIVNAGQGGQTGEAIPASALQQKELFEKMFNLKQKKKEKKERHDFWDTQPVPAHGTQFSSEENGAIEEKTIDQIPEEPYALPPSFKWVVCNINDPQERKEVYQLLSRNYVEDDDNMFRFDYSSDFLQWALQPPGYLPQLHLGVRATGGKQPLVGFITGIPAEINVHGKRVRMVEINFLCVHKKLRDKRLAPVLIKEVTRRVNRTGVWQAVYTAGVVLPKPVGKNRYYHRSLNPKKLIDVGFSRLHQRMTLTRTIKLYSLPKETVTPGIRPLEKKDCRQACKLLNEFLAGFKLTQHFSEAEFEHWLLPRKGVVDCFVVEDPETHQVTDMISFYHLPSSIIGNDKYEKLNAAYSFYNFSTKTPWEQLMGDALILAKQLDFDVFNCLDVMLNETFLKPLKFGIGDGHLQYYLYNWKCPEMSPGEVGLVLL
eukprot:gb/GEZN01005343.1/.p1 GENE.gb/GEZN01005343.1/~~gb/GEZN01005343.1/.p1  ORF type:complete len:482 (+),score=82.73 gb/GEZN01005343.1/:28-1473(+)